MNISKDNKRKIIGAGAALLFHLLIVIVLLAFGLPYQDPPPKEIGVEMSADDLTEAEDDGMAGQTGGGETTDDPAVSSNNDDSPSITQNSEQVPLAAKPAKEKPKVQPKEAKPEVDETALFSKGKVKKTGSGQGTGTGNGMSEGQGSGQGQKGEGAGESGISYSLSGRGSKSLSAPNTNTTKTGKVVIEIKVDQQGNVIEAHADPLHSSIFDTNIWRTCEQAAKRSKFTAKENAPEVQRGTITYKLQH